MDGPLFCNYEIFASQSRGLNNSCIICKVCFSSIGSVSMFISSSLFGRVTYDVFLTILSPISILKQTPAIYPCKSLVPLPLIWKLLRSLSPPSKIKYFGWIHHNYVDFIGFIVCMLFWWNRFDLSHLTACRIQELEHWSACVLYCKKYYTNDKHFCDSNLSWISFYCTNFS